MKPNEQFNQGSSSAVNSQTIDVYVGELGKWDLSLFDQQMQLVARYNLQQGSQNRLPSTYPNFKTTSKKPYSGLWYSGTQHLSIVDARQATQFNIRNFWNFKNK